MNIFKPKGIFWGIFFVFIFLLTMAQPCHPQKVPKLIIPRFDKGSFVSSNQYVLNRLMEILAIGGKLEVTGPELVKYELKKKKSGTPLNYEWKDKLLREAGDRVATNMDKTILKLLKKRG